MSSLNRQEDFIRRVQEETRLDVRSLSILCEMKNNDLWRDGDDPGTPRSNPVGKDLRPRDAPTIQL